MFRNYNNIVHEFISLMNEHYCHFDTRGVRDEWVEASKNVPYIENKEHAKKFLHSLIEFIDDQHLWIKAGNETIEPRHPRRPSLPTKFEWSQKYVWDKCINKVVSSHGFGFGTIDKMGYIKFDNVEDDFNQFMDSYHMSMRNMFVNCSHLIIDITDNEGGMDEYARKFAGMFTRDKVLAYTKWTGNNKLDQRSYYIIPNEKPIFLGKIFLMVAQDTISAAEVMTLCFANIPNVLVMGEPTSGSFSDLYTTNLSNGWEVNLSNEFYVDYGNRQWEGIGFMPHVNVKMSDSKDDTERTLDFMKTM